MAMVPKYTSRASVPGSTGMQNVPLSLATSPLEGVGEGLTKISGQLEAAADRVQKREDVISRGRDEDAFKTAVSTEWHRVQDQEDLTDRKTFGTFNAFVNQQKANLLSNHRGSANSLTLLDAGLTDLSGRYERSAISATREAQISNLSKQFGDKGNQIIAQVASGSMDTARAFVEITKFAVGDDTIGGALPTNVRLDLVDALQSQIIITKIEKDLSSGSEAGIAAAKATLDQNPSFNEILSPTQLGNIVKRISDQETAINVADIAIAKGRQKFAGELGYSNYAAVPPALKLLYASGGKVAPPKPYEMQSPQGKQAQDRAYLVAKNGGRPDAPQVIAFDKQVASAERAKGLAGAPEIVRLFAERDRLEASGARPDNPALLAINEQINQKSPAYKLEQERAIKFPKAVASYESFLEKSKLQIRDVKAALVLLTGKTNIEDAKKAILNKEFNIEGYSSKIAETRPGSSVNELKELLTAIGGRVFLDTFAEMKMNSPTGSAQMGALSDAEGQKITFSKGALDWKAPQTTGNTLVGLLEGMQSVRASQRKALSLAFPTLGERYASPDDAVVVPGDGGGDTDATYFDLAGEPVK